MKFIHTADIHLDSPLTGLGAYPDAPATQLRSASRDAFTALVERAIDEEVDFFVIAGDLYDGTWRDFRTGLFFCAEMGRLKRAGIPVFVLYGNHDAESEMTRKLDLPDNVKLFPHNKPATFKLDDLRVAIHGHSFKNKETTDNLARNYPAPIEGYYNIGVLHTALEGYAAHVSYAPCTVEELRARGYQYWALGHVHEFQEWPGPTTIVFPGNLQGRNVRECGRKGAVLVTVDDQGETFVERIFIDVLRWEHVRIDASSCTALVDISRKVGAALEGLLDDGAQVPRAVRVTVHGKTSAHGSLFGREAQLRNEVLAQIAGVGHERLWLEKVRIETEAVVDAAHVSERMDAFSDLREILESASEDVEFIQLLGADLGRFTGKTPLELQALVPALEKLRVNDLSELLKEVSPSLLAYIAGSEQ